MNDNTLELKQRYKNDKLYRTWRFYKNACENDLCSDYDRYGARGIRMCDAWSKSFSAFLAWAEQQDYVMGMENIRVCRIDTKGDLEPTNCFLVRSDTRTVTDRRKVMVEYKGRTYSLRDLCRDHGYPYHAIYARLRRGWTIEEAIEVPVNRYVRSNIDYDSCLGLGQRPKTDE